MMARRVQVSAVPVLLMVWMVVMALAQFIAIIATRRNFEGGENEAVVAMGW